MRDSNMIDAKFHMGGPPSVIRYFDPTMDIVSSFLPIYDKPGKQVGAVLIAAIVYIEFLVAE